MVDQLVEASESHAVSNFLITDQNIFVIDKVFIEAGLIENVAQTAALQSGYWCHQLGVAVRPGFIAAIKNLKIDRMPAIGSSIVTEIRITNMVLDAIIIQASIRQEDRLICTCEMRVFIKPLT
jgi:hypothetical protein